MLADLTIIPANTAEEAGKILENYKIYENKPPDFIQEKQDSSIMQQVNYGHLKNLSNIFITFFLLTGHWCVDVNSFSQ